MTLLAAVELWKRAAQPQAVLQALNSEAHPPPTESLVDRLWVDQKLTTFASNPGPAEPGGESSTPQNPCAAGGFGYGAGGTRTHDLRFRKPSLYPAELQPHAGKPAPALWDVKAGEVIATGARVG